MIHRPAFLLGLLALLPLAQSACNLAGNMFVDEQGYYYAIDQGSGTTVVIHALNSSSVGWVRATGTIDAKPMFCPGGGATLQPACHTVSVRFDHGGTVTGLWDCHRGQLLQWSNKAGTWFIPDDTVKNVHIVYMTHLDIGFTNTSRHVCDLYFDTYFPKAFNTSRVLRERGGVERYQWTEFPWLIQEYLDGAVNCSHRPRTATEVKQMEAAIAADDIIWHGNALNNFLELEDAGLFNFSLQMAQELNTKFGKGHGRVTGKHTDVPGMSKSAIPLLSAAGIKGYHIGYNGACKKPEVLPPISRWQHEETHTEILLMAEGNYGTKIRPPGSDFMLAFMYQVDNSGPPTAEEVLAFWTAMRTQFPKAVLTVSSLDAFISEVVSDPQAMAAMPVVKGEIGDSWLYGSPADPIKLATFREARRTMQSALNEGRINHKMSEYSAFMRRLLKGPPEHNWGWATGIPVPTIHTDPWDNAGFEKTKSAKGGYDVLEAEWSDQRTYCTPLNQVQGALSTAVSPKWDAFVREDLVPRLELAAHPPFPVLDADEWFPLDTGTNDTRVSCGHFDVSFDGQDGSISGLMHRATGYVWATPAKRLAQLHYQTYSIQDFDTFNLQYNAECGAPCGDFSKSGMQGSSRSEVPKLMSLHQRHADHCELLVELAFDSDLHLNAGAPGLVMLNVSIPNDSDSIHLTLHTHNKTATRLAEAMWISFHPRPNVHPSEWNMDVLGRPVNPMEVIANGTRHIHAVWQGVTWTSTDGNSTLHIASLDDPLVSPSDIDHLLRYDGDTQPDKYAGGMHFNLHNNLWGTAFPQWFGDDTRHRFQLALSHT